MLAFLEKGDWREAFFSVLPQRKGATPLDRDDDGAGGAAAKDSDSDSDAENGSGGTLERNCTGTRPRRRDHHNGTDDTEPTGQ